MCAGTAHRLTTSASHGAAFGAGHAPSTDTPPASVARQHSMAAAASPRSASRDSSPKLSEVQSERFAHGDQTRGHASGATAALHASDTDASTALAIATANAAPAAIQLADRAAQRHARTGGSAQRTSEGPGLVPSAPTQAAHAAGSDAQAHARSGGADADAAPPPAVHKGKRASHSVSPAGSPVYFTPRGSLSARSPRFDPPPGSPAPPPPMPMPVADVASSPANTANPIASVVQPPRAAASPRAADPSADDLESPNGIDSESPFNDVTLAIAERSRWEAGSHNSRGSAAGTPTATARGSSRGSVTATHMTAGVHIENGAMLVSACVASFAWLIWLVYCCVSVCQCCTSPEAKAHCVDDDETRAMSANLQAQPVWHTSVCLFTSCTHMQACLRGARTPPRSRRQAAAAAAGRMACPLARAAAQIPMGPRRSTSHGALSLHWVCLRA